MDEFINYLKSKSKEELEEELKELYSSFESVRAHYDFKNDQSRTRIKKNLEQYKTKIHEALNLDSSWQGGFDIDKVDRILSRLNSESNIEYYFELGLYALEECTNLANCYGGDFGERFYDYFVNLYDSIVSHVWRKGLDAEYQRRLEIVMEDSFEGYGYKDELSEIYYNHYSN